MELISAILFSLCAMGIVYYFAVVLSERRLIKERVKKVAAAQTAVHLEKSDLLKPDFFAGKLSLRRTFDFKISPTITHLVWILLAWSAGVFFIFFKLHVGSLSKLIFAVVLSLFLLRILKIITVRRRRSKIERELPGTLDLIVICLEAGLSINAAFLRVSNEMENSILGGELRQTFNEVSAGMPVDIALKNFAKRTEISDVNAIVVAVIQAQKMGTAIGTTFRVQAESLREQYKMRIKEKIMKMPIKILFPLVFFIFPTIFVIILGPAAVSVIRQFSH